jgi:hypothetical protein
MQLNTTMFKQLSALALLPALTLGADTLNNG